MTGEPNIVGIAALIGDQARAKLFLALMAGQALTATELAGAAGVTKQTVSSHLAKLVDARLLAVESQGRHRYFRLAGRDVARLLESLMGLATRLSGTPTRQFGPREPALRQARVCYDHLAGDLAVQVFDSLERRCFSRPLRHGLQLSAHGVAFFREFGIDIDALSSQRRVLCRACLDWSARRHHLAGALGAALLTRYFELGWARRAKHSRAVIFTAQGQLELRRQFQLDKMA
jgi:DNA-binding transcriptional ArsR family regulator